MRHECIRRYISLFLFLVFINCSTAFAEPLIVLSKGQTVYVSVYANVFSGPKALPFDLATMLSIRNTDIHNQMKVTSVEFFDNDGKMLKKYLDKPMILGPLASNYVYIKESGESGGFGANFIVKWEAGKEINMPIIESIMIGAKSGQGISFVSQGQVISERTK